METHEVIKQLREQRGMSQDALAEKVGYKDRSSIAKVEAGLVDLSQSKIAAFAKALGVSPAILIGVGEDPVLGSKDDLPSNLIPARFRQAPLIGEIACGTPILAEQNIIDYIDVPEHIQCDFALKCRGNSMIDLGVKDGDVVYIRSQPEVQNGQVAAVIVDGAESEATLKKFFRYDNHVMLIPANSEEAPFAFYGEEMSRVHVQGLAVGFTHMFGER